MTDSPDAAWEQRMAQAWTAIDDMPPEAFVDRIERLVAELAPQHGAGLFERACAQDSTGHPDVAAPLYRAALAQGLTACAAAGRRSRWRVRCATSATLRKPPRCSAPNSKRHPMSSTARCVPFSRWPWPISAVSAKRWYTLTALSHSLPRYNRSLARYARELAPPPAA